MLPFSPETGIPGSLEIPPSNSSSTQLYTHSNKFPIERQITLSSSDKNFKIPILNDLKKSAKVSVIAPDVPRKRIIAWTHPNQMQPHHLYSNQPYSGSNQPVSQSADLPIHSTSYCPEIEQYNRNPTLPQEDSTSQQNTNDFFYGDRNAPLTSQQVETQITNDKTNKLNAGGVSKTYHAIKDIISGKFRNKEPENHDLNNIARHSRKSLDELPKRPPQPGCNVSQVTEQQCDFQVFQKHSLVQQSQQYYTQQLRTQQQHSQLARTRSQDLLKNIPDEQAQHKIYGNYLCQPETPVHEVQNQQQNGEGLIKPETRVQMSVKDIQKHLIFDRRSAQQIERDHLIKRNLEARRTVSHPHLLLDTEEGESYNGNFEHSINIRRSSLGNILESNNISFSGAVIRDCGRESDDGGFLNVTNSVRKCLTQPGRMKQNVCEINHNSIRIHAECIPAAPKRKNESDPGGRASSNIDSGRGSAAYSSGRRPPLEDVISSNISNSRKSPRELEDAHDEENDSEWVDVVEKELRHILEPKLLELSLQSTSQGVTCSNLSESISSITPPLPILSGAESFSPSKSASQYSPINSQKNNSSRYDGYMRRLNQKEITNYYTSDDNIKNKLTKKTDPSAALRDKQIFGIDTTDLTSTTTRSLDLESLIDGQSDSDGNLSVSNTKAIRKQLEGLENMYSEVLKFLGVTKRIGRYQPSDPRIHKKRHGSISSLPSSSVSSVRRERRYKKSVSDDRKRGREPRATARRFQRLEAHVVTLARSVAHLSSEMRTQHLVIQEIEAIRQEIAALRTQINLLHIRSQSASRLINVELPTLTNPTRVKKLTKFFGDEPPLLRLFLRKLGYEKYANIFETEKIGMVELPYLSEDRLQKMGIPLGPRLRIMQEAQISVFKENTLCIV